MELREICALPVGELAAPDALLFLWVPAPILAQAMQVIPAWGFDYRTGMVWVKQSSIPGRYIRSQHEHLLIARRGEFPTPRDKDRPSSAIFAQRREHSRKPRAHRANVPGSAKVRIVRSRRGPPRLGSMGKSSAGNDSS
jgi:N6-adenosine-specific RNA methylase IME4